MNTDIRIAVSFMGHRKRKRLRLLLGPGSTDYLIDLWIATAMNHPSGILQGMDETDIALEAGWDEDPQKFVSALIECGFLEVDDGVYSLHDWGEHQSYVVKAPERKAYAQHAASKRWAEKRNADSCGGHAEGMPKAMRNSQNGNAPLPSPSPSPVPEKDSSLRSESSCPGSAEPDEQNGLTDARQPDLRGKKQAKLKPQPLPEDSEAYRLAVYMRDTLRTNVPTLKEPDLQKWAQAFDVALRNDERMREPRFVAQVVKWACSDSFWRANIQSPDKLRKQFDQLTAKMEAEAAKARASPVGYVSPAQRRLEANRRAMQEFINAGV